MKTTIACGQFSAKPGDIPANAAVIAAQAAEAASRGAAAVVFPELCLSGYLPGREIPRLAVRVDGAEIASLRDAARTSRIAICFGFAEKAADGTIYNSLAFIDASGSIASTYRKVHLFGDEAEWAGPGSGYAGFSAGSFRCGMWICYDTRFPEAARALALDGVTCALAGTAWLGPPEELELAVRARAMDNGMFVAMAALQGGSGALECSGASLIADPHGRIIARGMPGRTEVIAAEYDPDAVASFRKRLPLLADRRPGAYGGWGRAMDRPS